MARRAEGRGRARRHRRQGEGLGAREAPARREVSRQGREGVRTVRRCGRVRHVRRRRRVAGALPRGTAGPLRLGEEVQEARRRARRRMGVRRERRKRPAARRGVRPRLLGGGDDEEEPEEEAEDRMIEAPGIENAAGLDREAKEELESLLGVAARVAPRNASLRRVYEGDFFPPTIGIDPVPEAARPGSRCEWPRKAVDAVAKRSRLQGFVFDGGASDPTVDRLVTDRGLLGSYNRNVPNALVHGCMFATVNNTPRGASVRFHSAETAAATWDAMEDRVGSGLVAASVARAPWSRAAPAAMQMNLHLPERVVVLRRAGPSSWEAESLPHPMGRPMMEAFCFQPSGMKPFGRSRITGEVVSLACDVMRTLDAMAVSSALYAHPKEYLLGLTDEQFDELVGNKRSVLINSLLMMTRDEDGRVPEFGQLAAVSPQPYIDLLRAYASLFSGATSVPLNSLGIVQDNPSSAEAIQAAREDICIDAEDLNESSRTSMRSVALMAMAVDRNVSPDGLTDVQKSVMPLFADPSKPSVVSQADAMVKVAAADPDFAGTDVFYEGIGFDQATIERIASERRRRRHERALADLLAGGGGYGSGGPVDDRPMD
ncbi:phage portal protein [Eggerthellaceae bacterium zg-893]|nr:phage portal protein [Eggerthellaceae bacterium zg-893]